jgi:phosphoribosylamine--glycine ligase
VLARLDDDLLEFLHGAATGRLPDREPRFSPDTALTVIVAAKGYPGAVEKGARIRGWERAAEVPGVVVLHAGTKRIGDEIVADGGRVLAVTALGKDVVEARERAYAAIARIDFPGGFFRRDIAARALNRRPAS